MHDVAASGAESVAHVLSGESLPSYPSSLLDDQLLRLGKSAWYLHRTHDSFSFVFLTITWQALTT